MLYIEERKKLRFIDYLQFWRLKRLLGDRRNYFYLGQEEIEI